MTDRQLPRILLNSAALRAQYDPAKLACVAGALRLFNEQFRLYQYLLKRRVRGIQAATHPNAILNDVVQRRAAFLSSRCLYTLEIYFVVLLEPRPPRERWARRMARFAANPIASLGLVQSDAAAAAGLADDLGAAVARLRAQVGAFCIQLADSVNPFVANKREAFALFRRSRTSTDPSTPTRKTLLSRYHAVGSVRVSSTNCSVASSSARPRRPRGGWR